MKKTMILVFVATILTSCSKQDISGRLWSSRSDVGIILKTVEKQSILPTIRVYPYIALMMKQITRRNQLKGQELWNIDLLLARKVVRESDDETLIYSLVPCDLLAENKFEPNERKLWEGTPMHECITDYIDDQIDLSGFGDMSGYIQYTYVYKEKGYYDFIDIKESNYNLHNAIYDKLYFTINNSNVTFPRNSNWDYSFL